MGGGYYERDDDNVVNSSSTSYNPVSSSSVSSSVPSSGVGTTSSLNPGLDPKRWATEKLVCDKGDPIVFALDVTGSMGSWTKVSILHNFKDYI